MGAIDLEAYFGRIGYTGPRAATFEVLQALHRAHVETISFESLNPLLGRPVELAPHALEDKLVRHARGGYCFEQNGLFLHVLRDLGFKVTPLAARVRWKLTEDAPASPLSHMLLLVHLSDGEFHCDVGFGGQSPPVPLRFEPNLEQPTSHGGYRLKIIPEGHQLEMRTPDGWMPMYRFRLEAQAPRDYEVYNWYTSTHPASRFVNNLVAARIVGDKRLTLLNREMGVRLADGSVRRSEVATPQALHNAITCDFGIEIEIDEIVRVWPRLPKPD